MTDRKMGCSTRSNVQALCAISILCFATISARAQESGGPLLEAGFCSTIENASSDYKGLDVQRADAETRQNALRADQIEGKQTAVFRQRNKRIFEDLKRSHFRMEKWQVVVIQVRGPMDDCHKNVRSCVTIDVHPTCSDTTLIHLYLPTSPARLELLANKSVGDRLTVTGSFVEKNGGAMSADAPVMPTSWDDLEGSFTESGAMKEPEYSADISALE